MIEKLMKAVKSSNKKRGRNITVGAVVGLLLSCTAVMGADEYLWIRENAGEIEFNTILTTDKDDTDGNWNKLNPYEKNGNEWDGSTNTYINNTTLSSSTNNGEDEYGAPISYGLRLSDLENFNFINNGIVSGYGYGLGDGYGYGINISDSKELATIINEGAISGSGSGSGFGINIFNSNVVAITNEGAISGSGSGSGYGFGINIFNSNVVAITNEGAISGSGSGLGSGINISDSKKLATITNEGAISGSGSGSGYGFGINIFNSNVVAITNEGAISGSGYGINISNSPVKNLTNTGVVYGSTSAIRNIDGGTGNNAVNYGILANGSGSGVVDGLTVTNHGLIIKNGTIEEVGNYNQLLSVSVGNETKSMTIENKDDINITASFSGDKTNHILNGVTETYKVSNANNKVTGSIINAYQTAVAFDTAGGKLTLFGTTVNGGLDGTSNTIAGNDGADTLGLYNTIINGNIFMDDGDDELTIGTGTIINGTLDGGADDDTLNFGTSSNTRAGSDIDDNINIQHNISGFENMNINTNVTLFEKTINASGGLTDLTVTGGDNITIGKNGVLTLRINSADSNKHALSTGNTGTIKSENGGKLLLALNGAGNNSIISFGSTKLGDGFVTEYEGTYLEDVTLGTTSIFHSVKKVEGTKSEIEIAVKKNLPRKSIPAYEKLNKIYQGIISVDKLGNFNAQEEDLPIFLEYLNSIYGGNPYSFSSELSRKSAGMFRDIVTENQFKANTGKWMIYGGLTHVDGGTKDTYYGKGYYTYDVGSSDIDADTKITGAYMLGEYGVSDTLTSGIVIGGNRLKSDLSNGSKVDGDALYLGAYAKKYIGNLKVTGGVGFQYGDYDADRLAVNKVASEEAESVMKYSDNYNDITYDIYLNGRYSHNIGENLFLEPYATLSYTYIDQDGADEGGKTLAIETDSKSFDYTTAKVGLDLKKVIPHEKGKSTLSAGVSYTRILDGADEEYITGRFKGGRDFDILVAHKNEHSIGLNAKYSLELENGILFDVKGTYSVERDSHNQSGKNKTKGEWIVGTGLGYKF